MRVPFPKLKIAGLLALILTVTMNAFSGGVRTSLSPNVISPSEQAQLIIEFVDTQPRDISIPKVDGLQFRQLGPSTQSTTINGNTTRSIVYQYIINPQREGTFKIDPIVISYNGGQKTTSAELTVATEKPLTSPQEVSDIIFARLTAKSPAGYVNEPFELEYKVYARRDVELAWSDTFGRSTFSMENGIPEGDLDGAPEMKMTQNGQRKLINGWIFNTYTISIKCKPLRSGTLHFKPQAQIYAVSQQRSRDPFESMFLNNNLVPIDLECNALDIEIASVPLEGRPASYSGAVGNFDFQVEVTPSKVKQGSPITVKMKITGTGNMDRFPPPELLETPNLKVYEIQKNQTTNPEESRYEQAVIPTSEAVTEIPALTFSYFDTQSRTFQTITRGPFPIEVEPAPQSSAQITANAAQSLHNGTDIIETDIAYLKPTPEKWIFKTEHTNTSSRWMLPLPALFLAAAGGMALRKNKRSSNTAQARRQQAPKAARKHILMAEKAAKDQDGAAFDEALWNALTAYFGHRFNLAPGEITLQIVQDKVPEEADAIQQIFDTIEQARYASGTNSRSPSDMKDLLSRLTQILRKCERMKR
ncbi:MAG: protein BatD [Pontiellaceae bacterium]|nr:protein BatD [Pontiellaceae bacterium]